MPAKSSRYVSGTCEARSSEVRSIRKPNPNPQSPIPNPHPSLNPRSQTKGTITAVMTNAPPHTRFTFNHIARRRATPMR